MFLKSTLIMLSSLPIYLRRKMWDLVSQTLKACKSFESWNLGNNLERGWGWGCRKWRKTPSFVIFNPQKMQTQAKRQNPEENTVFFFNSLEIASPENARKTPEYKIFSLRLAV